MVTDCVGDGLRLTLRLCEIAPERSLKLRKLANDLGHEVGLGQLRRSPDFVDARAGNQALLHKPFGELGDACDLVGGCPELLVEYDAAELRSLRIERNLQVLLPEETSVRQPRGQARGDCPRRWLRRSSFASMLAMQTNAGARAPTSSVQAKYFWFVRMVRTITSRGTSR